MNMNMHFWGHLNSEVRTDNSGESLTDTSGYESTVRFYTGKMRSFGVYRWGKFSPHQKSVQRCKLLIYTFLGRPARVQSVLLALLFEHFKIIIQEVAQSF